jgi:hypothetical protein
MRLEDDSLTDCPAGARQTSTVLCVAAGSLTSDESRSPVNAYSKSPRKDGVRVRHKVSPLRELPKAFRHVLHAMCPKVKHRNTHMSNLAMAMLPDPPQGRLRLLEDKVRDHRQPEHKPRDDQSRASGTAPSRGDAQRGHPGAMPSRLT